MDDIAYPVHPGDLQHRVRKLIASGQDWATQSDIVLSMLGWMVRTGELKLPLTVTYVQADGGLFTNLLCDDGNFLHDWPEANGPASIVDAGFHYRNMDTRR